MLPNADYLGNSGQKKAEKYYCKCCDYSTSYLSKWNRHLKTKKHNATKMLPNADYLGNSGQKKAENAWICGCGKSYKHKQSFYRHKAKCTYINETKDELKENNIAISEESKEKTITLTASELQNIITESVKAASGLTGQSIRGNNNNQIQNNFNIQLFLNEKCAKAASIQDFAKKLKLTMGDLSLMKENEPKAITNIIVKNLKDYTEVERPFHHHQKKWYIKDKDEGWDNEGKESGEILVKNVKVGVSQKAPQVFVDNNPDFLTDEKQGKNYAETVSVVMKDVSDRNTNKILKSVKTEVEVGKE